MMSAFLLEHMRTVRLGLVELNVVVSGSHSGLRVCLACLSTFACRSLSSSCLSSSVFVCVCPHTSAYVCLGCLSSSVFVCVCPCLFCFCMCVGAQMGFYVEDGTQKLIEKRKCCTTDFCNFPNAARRSVPLALHLPACSCDCLGVLAYVC